MRMTKVLLATLAAGVVATGASAQQAPPPITLSAYYRCDFSKEARADTLFRQVIAPALDRQVKAGHFTGYGFSSHVIGGAWRRVASITAPTIEHLIAGRVAYQADLDKTNPKGSADFDAVCGSHDDYIWERTVTSATNPAAAAEKYGYSRYMSCDLSKEGEADLIMAQVFAPIMNKHLAAGHLTSWTWLTHYMGGPVRRVLRWTAPDMVSALKAEEMVSEEMGNSPMNTAFAAACSGHSDYLWQTEVVSP